MQQQSKVPLSRAFSTLLVIHPPRLARPLCRPALHLLMREALPVRARLRVVALPEPLLAAEAKLVVLLRALVVAAVTAIAAATVWFVGFVECDVEEVFFVGGGDIGAGAFWSSLATCSFYR
jgi:hypothetical protein